MKAQMASADFKVGAAQRLRVHSPVGAVVSERVPQAMSSLPWRRGSRWRGRTKLGSRTSAEEMPLHLR